MTTAVVVYHHENDSWWAESPAVDGFSAVGATIDKVRTLAREGVPYYLDSEEEIVEVLAGGAPLDCGLARVASLPAPWWSATATQVRAGVTGSAQHAKFSLTHSPQGVSA